MARIVEVVKPKIDTSLQIKRVCAYARVSTGKESMLHSLSAQVSYYQDYIQSHPGWQFCGIFADAAYTGTKENRTQFQKMLSECRDGNIDLIVTKSISRFARNTITLLQTVRDLKNIGIEVYFEEQDIYSLSTEGEVMPCRTEHIVGVRRSSYARTSGDGKRIERIHVKGRYGIYCPKK